MLTISIKVLYSIMISFHHFAIFYAFSAVFVFVYFLAFGEFCGSNSWLSGVGWFSIQLFLVLIWFKDN